MCNALQFSPLPESGRNLVGDGTVNFLTTLDGPRKAFVSLIAEKFTGRAEGKYIFLEDSSDFGGSVKFYRSFL